MSNELKIDLGNGQSISVTVFENGGKFTPALSIRTSPQQRNPDRMALNKVLKLKWIFDNHWAEIGQLAGISEECAELGLHLMDGEKYVPQERQKRSTTKKSSGAGMASFGNTAPTEAPTEPKKAGLSSFTTTTAPAAPPQEEPTPQPTAEDALAAKLQAMKAKMGMS